MSAPCQNTTQTMKLLEFVGTENLVLCFLCHMQKCCKLCSMVNAWSSNYSLISFSCSLYNDQVCQKVLYLFNANICADSISGRVYPEPQKGKFAIFQAFFPLDLLIPLLPAYTHTVHAFQIE